MPLKICKHLSEWSDPWLHHRILFEPTTKNETFLRSVYNRKKNPQNITRIGSILSLSFRSSFLHSKVKSPAFSHISIRRYSKNIHHHSSISKSMSIVRCRSVYVQMLNFDYSSRWLHTVCQILMYFSTSFDQTNDSRCRRHHIYIFLYDSYSVTSLFLYDKGLYSWFRIKWSRTRDWFFFLTKSLLMMEWRVLQ